VASFLEVNTTSEAKLTTRGRLNDHGRALLFTDARTANTFAPTPVTDEELAEIWELAKWPPTAANTQPLRVLYVRTDEGKQRLLPLMNDRNRDKTATAPAVAILAMDSEYHEHIPDLVPYNPALKDFFAGDDNLRNSAGQFNAALQVGYFLLAVRSVGLAAGPMAGFDQEGADREFFPDGRFKSLLVVNIGEPGESPWHDRLPRLEHSSALLWA
jgi:3-hydroxypropanoate dehydrogenase